MRSSANPRIPGTLCRLLATVVVAACTSGIAAADDRETAFERVVAPFFEQHCNECHGPTRGKGGVTLHTLRGDISAGAGPKRWDKVLEVIERGTMPPDTEEQPKADERKVVAGWIRAALRDELRREQVKADASPVPSSLRRLTNAATRRAMVSATGAMTDLNR